MTTRLASRFIFAVLPLFFIACKSGTETAQLSPMDSLYSEPHRPRIHFSPKEKWMNDPNGMVYYKGVYHLFYQHYPDSTVWGPMHWGHATSKDLIHWEHLPIAIYPDSLGLIFSGSAVVDVNNTSGLGSAQDPPLIAIYTYHSMEKEKAGRTDYQTQGLAYSNDDGVTWKKYDQNPVLKNPGIKDFRDPKVFWYEPGNKWIMTLAVQDHIEFYDSPNLLNWTKVGEFGKDKGAHGGVWECPDLFELPVEGSNERHWVLLVSINPGGPNGGSATQYFVGDFDGKTFRDKHNTGDTAWLDYGPDNYAGVTWSNAPDNRKIFLGWMSNWAYTQVVPTERWRGATTLPRELALRTIDGKKYVVSSLVPELIKHAKAEDESNANKALSVIEGSVDAESFEYFTLSNSKGESLKIGYDKAADQFYIDRSKAGNVSFASEFVTRPTAPRLAADDNIPYKIVTDVSSVEIFFDNGLSVMTATFFPAEPFTDFSIEGGGEQAEDRVSRTFLKRIW